MITSALGWARLCGSVSICVHCSGYVAKSMCAVVCIHVCIQRFLGVVHMYSYGYVCLCACVAVYSFGEVCPCVPSQEYSGCIAECCAPVLQWDSAACLLQAMQPASCAASVDVNICVQSPVCLGRLP